MYFLQIYTHISTTCTEHLFRTETQTETVRIKIRIRQRDTKNIGIAESAIEFPMKGPVSAAAALKFEPFLPLACYLYPPMA